MNNMQLAKYMFDYYNIPFTNEIGLLIVLVTS